MTPRSLFLLLACAIAAGLAVSFAAVAQAPPTPGVAAAMRATGETAAEVEELIFELRLNNLVLSEAFPGLLRGASLLLPLGDLARALEFPISEDPRAGYANGWFLRENRLFSLDVGRAEVVLEGRPIDIDRRMIIVEPDGIYVDIRQLARWFPVDFSFDTASLTVFIMSREPLPVEERLARGLYRQRAFAGRRERREYARVDSPPAMLAPPVGDLSAEFTARREPESGSTTSLRYSGLMTGEMLYANSEVYFAGDDEDRLTDMRIRLERKDPDGRALGRLGVREAAVGDVLTPEMPLVAKLQLGRGAVLSNMDLETPEEFDRITLEGNLPLGWEIELYRNEVLLEFQTASADGRYRFEDVSLLFGVNVLRLIFYGPQGQRREEVRQVRVDTDQINAGEIRYRIAANQHDTRLYSRSYDGTDPNVDGRPRGLVSTMLGITDWLTLGTNLASLPRDERRGEYAGTALIATTGNFLWRLDGVSEVGAGTASRLSGQTSILGVSLFGEHGIYDDFLSEQATGSAGNLLKKRSRLRLDGVVPWIDSLQLPFSISGDRDRRQGGDTTTRIGGRMSAGVGRASVTNRLDWTVQRGPSGASRTATGNFLVGGPVGDFRLRGQIDYQAAPESQISALAMSAEKPIWQQSQVRLGVAHDIWPDQTTTLSAGLSTRLHEAYVGVRCDVDDQGEVMGLFTVSTSFGYDPVKRSPWMSAERRAETGQFAGRVFIDEDNDGAFDDGEPLIPDARLVAAGQRKSDPTGEDGRVLMTGLSGYRPTDIAVDPGSLEDPFWVPQPEGISIVPRPGSTATHDFAVVSTGEVDGTVFRVIGGKARPVSGAVVQLVGEKGEVVRTERSAYDGFYLFQFVPPGRYRVRVDPMQLHELDLIEADTPAVEITGNGSIVGGQKIVLLPVSG
ncbi:MSCRAMM family protein [Shumkonia mesophila]|uniref:MSCRAMM family protein n=1 Tax=Shumkonia mesophila TaxID=2838854 RepID=UPI0029345CDC|nr:carboxypeptidase-like regulatory domain-containing protein [Shumkonia mesophila]